MAVLAWRLGLHFYCGRVSHKNEKISHWIRQFEGCELDAHYLGFVDFFNRQRFYEAHEILEVLWLPARKRPDGAFYKGLIQLAGAFVHLQKTRLRPAAALFKLARANLAQYPDGYQKLDTVAAVEIMDNLLNELESGQFTKNPLDTGAPPILQVRQ